jgi:hypothetical protein
MGRDQRAGIGEQNQRFGWWFLAIEGWGVWRDGYENVG